MYQPTYFSTPTDQVTTSQSQSFAATTPRALGLRQKACKVKDHTVMVNLATLACHALPLLPDALVTWAPSLWQSLGAWAQAHPQVSAWYKLARTLVKEVKELDNVSRSLLATFLSDVAEKTPSFHDELQLSCFQLILDVNDVSCVEVLLPFLPPVISSLLNLSSSLLWLAEATLVRLLEWLDKLGEEKMAAVLCTALPLLRPHLATDYASIMVEGKETTGLKKRRKQIKAGLQKLKVVLKTLGYWLSLIWKKNISGWRTRVWCASISVGTCSPCASFLPSQEPAPSDRGAGGRAGHRLASHSTLPS